MIFKFFDKTFSGANTSDGANITRENESPINSKLSQNNN